MVAVEPVEIDHTLIVVVETPAVAAEAAVPPAMAAEARVGPALLLLGISHPLAASVVVPKPPTAPILFIPSSRLVHLRFIILRQ